MSWSLLSKRHQIALGLAGWLSLRAMTATAQQPNLPQLITTNQPAFAIPYTIPVPRQPAETPVEIRLFVSRDQGRQWQLAESSRLAAVVEPLRGQFAYRAPEDGEYWFALRTVDAQGQLRGGKNGPELRVAVDSRQPRLVLAAQRGAAGEVLLRYQADDPLLSPESLRLSYQSAGQVDAKSIAPDRLAGFDPQKPLQGSVSFWPDRPGVELLVTAEIRDRAGNVSTQAVQVAAAAGSQGQAIAVPLAGREPLLPPGTPATSPSGDPPPSFPFNESANPGPRWNDVAGNSPRTAVPMTAATVQPTLAPPQDLPFNTQSPPQNFQAGNSGPALVGPGLNGPAGNTAPNDTAANLPWNAPLAGRVESRVSTPSVSVGPIDYRTPSGDLPRMVNSRTFEWEYELEAVGAAGISSVELWCTRDRGQSWVSVGVDPDNRSPIRTTVAEPGLYGYRMTVRSAGGPQPRAPQAGDQPEMWIGVDLTKPAARLLQAELGNGVQSNDVTITWEATDDYPAARPVTLSYSEQPAGPWQVIAAGLENNGRYQWRTDLQTPDRIYLKLEVRDEAGNVGESITVEPLQLPRSQPQIKLRQARPINENAGSVSRLVPAAQPMPAIRIENNQGMVIGNPYVNGPAPTGIRR